MDEGRFAMAALSAKALADFFNEYEHQWAKTPGNPAPEEDPCYSPILTVLFTRVKKTQLDKCFSEFGRGRVVYRFDAFGKGLCVRVCACARVRIPGAVA